MDLLPGRYTGAESFDQTIRIHENVFWFLEPAIKRHSPQYARPYTHWGVTAISRSEWEHILSEWETLVVTLDAVVLPVNLKILQEVPRYTRKEFIRSPLRNQRKLAALIARLIGWVRATLETYHEVSILGI